jgi:DNA-binding PadR family transcriptional regulator
MIYHADMSLTSIQFAVLGMLKLRPMTGYEIKQAYQKGPANFMPISFGQIYPALAKLGKEKMVRQDKQPGRRGSIRYFIIRKGEQALREWLFSPRNPRRPIWKLVLEYGVLQSECRVRWAERALAFMTNRHRREKQ